MAEKIYLNGVIAYRQDTLENWTSINPVLEKGEPAIVSDVEEGEWLKIGDGVSDFNSLPWKKGPKGDPYELTETDKNNIADIVLSSFTDVSEVGV